MILITCIRMLANSLVNILGSLGGTDSIRVTRLAGDEDLSKAQKYYFDRDAIEFPLSYLRNSESYFAVNCKGQVVGGFSIVFDPQLRVLQQIPSDARSAFLEGHRSKEIVEMTGAWLDKGSSLRSLQFWLHVFLKATSSKDRIFVFSYETRKKGLERLYKLVKRGEIYSGAVECLAGMQVDRVYHEAVCYSDCVRAAEGAVSYVWLNMKRAVGFEGLMARSGSKP